MSILDQPSTIPYIAMGLTHGLLPYRGGKHNDPASPDPKGPHWTVEMVKENGTHVTTKHVYPAK